VKVLDLFSGTGSATQPFVDRGHKRYRVDINQVHEADLYEDVLKVNYYDLVNAGPFDFIWASPPCTAFSNAALGMNHWSTDMTPNTTEAEDSLRLVAHTIRLIAALTPKYWVMENPRGQLRWSEVVRGIPYIEVTYCQYGTEYQKPTDLFGVLPSHFVGMRCAPTDKCHTIGLMDLMRDAAERAVVPYALGDAVCSALEDSL